MSTPSICVAKGCSSRVIRCYGLCNKHYKRLKRFGNPNAPLIVMREHDAMCAVADCEKPFHCKGYCKNHYRAFRKYGDPLGKATLSREHLRIPPLERFMEKIAIDQATGCWEWQGALNSNGYAWFNPSNPDRNPVSGHRWFYQQIKGPLSDELVLDHLCHNPKCVNLDHLSAVPQMKNAQNRGALDSRSKTGFRGVARASRSNKFRAYVGVNYRQEYLGIYDTAEEAAEVAAAARLRLHGDFALATEQAAA